MCGRFALSISPIELARQLGLPFEPDLQPRFNIAPGQDVAAVRETEGRERTFSMLRWGLVPFWARDPAIGNRMINARSETAAEKPAFKEALRRRRCLIPASGFFEWKTTGRSKQPFYIKPRDGFFTFAGLWERWQSKDDGRELLSCTILTTRPNRLVASLHDRMPVIIPRERHADWFSRDVFQLDELFEPLSEQGLTAYAVDRAVNNVRNESPSLIEPEHDLFGGAD